MAYTGAAAIIDGYYEDEKSIVAYKNKTILDLPVLILDVHLILQIPLPMVHGD